MFGFSGAKKRPPSAGNPVGALPLRRLRERPNARQLSFGSFVAGAQTVNLLTPVAYVEVAPGYVMGIKRELQFHLYLKSKHEAAIVADAAVTLAVDLAAAGYKIVQSTRPAPAFPTQKHPDVHAYISSDAGATWVATDVTAVNWGTSVVTITKNAATNRIKVYFLNGQGDVEVQAKLPKGSDNINIKLFGQSQRSIYEVDQTNERSALRIGLTANALLLPRWRLQLAVRSPGLIPWVEEANHEVDIPVFDMPVEILDLGRAELMAESELRGGG